MPRPNILIITLHDLGDYLGCYRTPVPTPNIDALAGQGVLFQNHFTCGSVCSPARGSIVTGCYPHTHGLMGLVHRGWTLNVDACPPLPEILAAAGYQTHLFGFQHEHYDPARLGYQEVHQAEGGHFNQIGPVLCRWLTSLEGGAGAAAAGRPFLAALGVSEVHRMGMNPAHFRHQAYPKVDPAGVQVRGYLPDIPQMRQDLAEFYGGIRLADECAGQIMAALDEAGLTGNTLVIFTTDHGASFMHSKGTLYDGGSKVACAMRWPAGFAAGVRHAGLTSHVDVLPTVLEACGLAVPDHVQGQTLAPAARGELQPGRPHVFAERNYNNYFNPSRMVRSPGWKYIRNALRVSIFDFLIPELELNPCGFRQNQAVFDFYSARRCREELYDLAKDPAEMHNVIDDPACADELAGLRKALDEHMERVDDPFRRLQIELLMPEKDYEEVRQRLKKPAS